MGPHLSAPKGPWEFAKGVAFGLYIFMHNVNAMLASPVANSLSFPSPMLAYAQ